MTDSMFGISNTCDVGSNLVGQNRETNEEHDEDCIEEEFLLTKMVKEKGKL